MIVHTYKTQDPFDLDDAGPLWELHPCHDCVSASVQANVVDGAATSFVLTVIVSNDPNGKLYQNHPSNITLTPSALITPVFSVAGYLFFGVKRTTINGANAKAHLYFTCKDSPAA